MTDQKPTRVLISLRRDRTPDNEWQEAWESPQKLVTRALHHLKGDDLISPQDEYASPTCRFMAVERWDPVMFLVFDLFNVEYDFLRAHHDGRDELPVVPVRLTRGGKLKSYPPQPLGLVNESIRGFHHSNGWDVRPPYWVDHADGAVPTHWHPRSIYPEREPGNDHKPTQE